MEHLEQHHKRIAAKRACLERLLELHARIYEIRHNMIALGKGQVEDRERRIQELREQVDTLLPEVELLQEQLSDEPRR